ncbi:MAG TPA: NAD-dependent epimerase/dehydratase [Vicinamibacterales bacterium]|jgi:nucleoside-diphosphate-sugar epimerase|nr:NAD-dependent epimerase/dehydratase [Vicinamibacterales bacterium]
MTRVLVTGGAGYLGSTLVPMLLDRGFAVTVVDNFMYGQDSLSAVCHHPAFSLVRGDVRSKTTMAPLVKNADVIIPLAALVGAPLCDRDPLAATSTNLQAIVDMLDVLSKEQRVLLPITNSGYGVGEPGKYCTEETPIRPISLYGRDKVEVERILLERHPSALSFRFATVFGMSPRMRLDLLVNDFTYRAYHDRFVVLFESHFKRNYLHVRDAARAFIHGIDNFEAMRGGPYNVGLSDANLSKLELCQRIQQQLPSFVFLESSIGRDPDQRDYIVSNEKIERTGFRTAYSLDDGIRELIKGFAMIRNSRYANV